MGRCHFWIGAVEMRSAFKKSRNLSGTPGWSCTKGGGAARRLCSRDRCSATAGRLDEWSGGYCSSRVPLQKPPTSSVWFAFPWDLTILSTPAGPGSTHPSHRLAAPAAPHLGMPGRQLKSFRVSRSNDSYMQFPWMAPVRPVVV